MEQVSTIQTILILVAALGSALAIALATAALVLGRPDSQSRSQLETLREEMSQMWDAIQGEIRRQAVRSSRASSATSVSRQAGQTLPSSDGTFGDNRTALLAEFERRQRGQVSH